MVFKFLRGEGRERMEGIEQRVQTMLDYDRHEFDLAMSALLGRVRADEVNQELRQRGDELLDVFDERVSGLIRAEDPGAQAVARALAHRYCKRVVAHLMNLLSAVTMPLDRLDYFDEDPEDRGGA